MIADMRIKWISKRILIEKQTLMLHTSASRQIRKLYQHASQLWEDWILSACV